ncbi:hypothetical protein B484DRAFT_437383, partial [Ochromonadaceae sp. CCMP2298]
MDSSEKTSDKTSSGVLSEKPSGVLSTVGGFKGALQRRASQPMFARSGTNNHAIKFSAILEQVSHTGEEEDTLENWRVIAKNFFRTSTFGRYYVITLLFFSVVSGVEYIYESYLDPLEAGDRRTLDALDLMELCFAFLFAFDFALNWFLADHKLIFFSSFIPLVDLLSTIPIFVTYGRTQPDAYHNWVYFIFVTISTVGYGDISPLSTQGRIAAMGIIGISLVSIPMMTNDLIEKMALQSVYMRINYIPKTTTSKHVVICGDLSSTSMNEFFEELFHEDHENVDLNAILLLPRPPTHEMILLMRDSAFLLNMQYLEGSALNDKDLKRARADSA